MSDRTESIIENIERLSMSINAGNSITPQILALTMELKQIHGKTMFYIEDIGGLKNAKDTCSSLKSMGLSKKMCHTQLTTERRTRKSYPVDVALSAINSVYFIETVEDQLAETIRQEREEAGR